MSDTKPALPEPVPPNAEGSTTCIVRWMVTTRDGLWLGAWDKEAFAAYTQAAIDAAVAEVNALNGALIDKCNSYIIANARLAEQVAEARAVQDGMLVALERAAEWVDHSSHGDNCYVSDHYDGDPGNMCNCGKESLLSHIADLLAATPSPAEQPKPAVLDRAAPASEGSGGDATEASLSDTKPLDDPRLQQLFGDAIEGALAFGYQGENAAPPGHWLERFWHLGRAEAEKTLAATPPPMPARLNDQRIVELMRPLADDALIRPHVIAAARAVIAEHERLNGISATPRQPLSEARIEDGRHETFSTNNPVLPMRQQDHAQSCSLGRACPRHHPGTKWVTLSEEDIRHCANVAHGRGPNTVDTLSGFSIAFARAVIAEYERLNGISATPRQPLSEAQIAAVLRKASERAGFVTLEAGEPSAFMVGVVRDVEAAHGITPAQGKETQG